MSVQVLDASPETSPFPARPSLGVSGRRLCVETNFFELKLFEKSALYQLDVKFSETKLPPEKRHEVFQQMRLKNPSLKIYFDGTAIAATNTKFEGGAEISTTQVILPSGGEKSKPITVTLKITDTLEYDDLAKFLSGKQEKIPQDYLKLLNIYLFHFAANDPGLAAFERSKSFFMLNGDRVKLQGGLDLLFGGFMSVRWGGVGLNMKPSEKLYLNVDTVATTFYSQGLLIERLRAVIPRANLNQKLYPNDLKQVEKALKKLKVQTVYGSPNWKKKKHTIMKLSKKSAKESTFPVDGKDRTIAEHFQIVHKITLKYPHLPCVTVQGGPSGSMELPIELCEVPDGIRHKGRLTGKQTSEIIKKTATKPPVRQEKILSLVKFITTGQAKDNSWNMKIADKMTMVDGRVLLEPDVLYGSKKSVRPNQGSWNTVGLRFIEPKNLESWALVDFMNDERTSHFFVSGFTQSANQRGMVIHPKPTIMSANPNGNLEQIINQVAVKTPGCKMIMFILPMDTGTLYPRLKKISDCALGTPTQCVVYTKLGRANDQYFTNVALKVNHKLGGTNNKLNAKLPMFDRPTMILGADVTHPTGRSDTSTSIASVVGSVSADANLYVARVNFQQGGQEFIDKFEDMFLQCLRLFKTRCQVLPERIIYYRDGVGEGMFKEVKRLEIAGLIKAFGRVPGIKTGKYRPTITMVVVQKRHHARFFPMKQSDRDKSGNCPAGMIIETGITHPREFDFYLQSQAGLQGTSRPTHYHVLHDENGFTPDSLQELTNRMCYLQGRSTRSVSIVPAVYHADLVCFRARCHLHEDDESESSLGKATLNPDDLAAKISVKLEKTMWWM